MSWFVSDAIYEFRQLLKNFSYTIVALMVLSLGIGINTVIFSGADAVLLRRLPYDDSPRMVYVWSTNLKTGLDRAGMSPSDFADFRSWLASFDSQSAFYGKTHSLMVGTIEPERISTSHISSNLFQTLKVRPMMGRDFSPQDDRPQADRVTIISYGLWQRRFGNDPDIIGRTLTLDGDRYTIAGVMERGFWFPSKSAELWLPLQLDAASKPRSDRFLTVVGSLKTGISRQAAQAEAGRIAAHLQDQYPDTNAGWGASIVPMRDLRLSERARTALYVLLAAVLFVLLIACANVANLMLANMTARRRELAVKAALGAARRRLVVQTLLQCGILSLLGSIGGLIIAVAGMRLLVAAMPPYLLDNEDLGFDQRMLVCNMMFPVLTCLACGILPAIRLSKPDLIEDLKEGGFKGGSAGATRRGAFHLLLLGEIAVSIVMMIGAGLTIRGFLHLQNFDWGFQSGNLLTFRIELPDRNYPLKHQQEDFFKRLLAECRSLPGSLNVAATDALPVSGRVKRSGAIIPLHVEGQPLRDKLETPSTLLHIVTPDYLSAMRIPILKGRDFSGRDTADAVPVALISESFARQHFAAQDPTGRRLELGRSAGATLKTDRPVVIGVVGSVRTEGPDRTPIPEVYVPYAQNISSSMTVVVRTAGNPGNLAPAVRAQTRKLDQRLPVDELATMDAVLGESYAGPFVFIGLLGTFAAMAVVIAAAGMYSVVSYTVSLRTHEIGVRMALGAEPRHIYQLVMKRVLLLVLGGALTGVPAGIALSRAMTNLLFGISPFDPLVYLVLSVFLALVGLTACYGPARRAIRIDPSSCMRTA